MSLRTNCHLFVHYVSWNVRTIPVGNFRWKRDKVWIPNNLSLCVLCLKYVRHWYNVWISPCLNDDNIKNKKHNTIMMIIKIINWGRDKMADILLVTFPNAINGRNIVEFWFKFDWKLLSINDKPVLVQFMACRLKGHKPLSWPRLVLFTNEYRRDSARWVIFCNPTKLIQDYLTLIM